jgi:hypothetical protein
MQNNPPSTPIPFQNIAKGASTIHYVDRLLFFLEKYLPDFPTHRILLATESENALTEALWQYLNYKRRFNPENTEYPFIFQTEASQKKPEQKGHAKRIDIGVHLYTENANMEIIYCMEAKKLPTDKENGNRAKEYVAGKGGAIERFKNEAHGLDGEGALLARNGIIAYVTEHDFQHWFVLINDWITEATWLPTEQLQMNYFNDIGKLTSLHPRSSGANLELTHFWVKL